ncbi:hypothetical protein [Cellulophaga sp. BC115SP]|nr:hypothetical protein [Cellulophaga sp. BC115SP]NBB30637.1 hypothetical protein [Cellulophaga sp. BC115SP]
MEEKELVSQKLQYASIIVSMASGLISIVWVSYQAGIFFGLWGKPKRKTY